ncbi:PREDICTED: uncharacterized protein LOC104748738 [Camelina sativa]|uniref:Uncharacterized protein LOC104748738 n=1 Tax=Camelina sativa TaxID=90675 RepID=A0ABM1R017_CAMSA|nr:PREDICTED: uncharacterized protein LOC104748738 [Camelina sativa]
MSLFLNQASMLCQGKPALMRSSHFLSNRFSSSSLQLTCNRLSSSPHVTKRRHTCLAKKKVPVDDRYEIMWHPYTCSLATFNHDGILGFIHSCWESGEPKHFSSPPLVTLPRCQTQIVNNVSSSSPLDDEDCVVAVKFLGPQISFFRPAQSNSGWTNVRIANPCFYSSQVMFSKKHNMFRIPGSGGHIIGSWDLHTHKLKTQNLRFRNLPGLTKTQRQLLESCCTSVLLLESESTDETLLVKWYRKASGKIMRTKAVMVFKLDHKGNATYTQDIGDLFIYLSQNENSNEIFCDLAAEFDSGLDWKPNYVEVLDGDWCSFSINLASGGLCL